MKFWKLVFVFLLGKILLPELATAKEQPRLVQGVLDVSDWDFEKDGPITFAGDVAFYWDRLMDPDPALWDASIQPAYIDVRGGWQKAGFPAHGKGTYRVRIESDRPVKLVLADFWAWSDVRLFVNGRLVKATQRTADGKVLYPFKEPTSLADEPGRSFDIVMQIENSDFYLGGIINLQSVGLSRDIFPKFLEKVILNAGVFFALLILALYNIGLYVVNRNEWGPLLIAGCCLSVCGLVSLEPGISHFVHGTYDRLLPLRIYNISYYLLLPLLWTYMKVVFPDLCHTRLSQCFVAVGVILAAITVWAPVRIYLIFGLPYNIANVFTLGYMIVQSTKAARANVLGARVFLLGVVVATVFAVLAILIGHGKIPVFPAGAIGMLFFCFCQSLIMSIRFAETLRLVQRSEVEIRTLNENLQEKEKARTLFFHNTSHELRTPLNGIIGFVDLIEKGRYGEVTDAAKTQLTKVKNLAVSLKQQVNTILDLAKSKQGKLALRNSQFALGHLLQDSRNLAEGLNLKKPQVHFHLASDLPKDALWIHDYEKVFTIIRNLIGNAFKFTAVDKPSLVQLTLKLAADNALEIEVKDTGIGIPARHRDKIFQEFQQLESDARRAYEGTGLGLAMVRDLINLMGGTIQVESEEGQGSTFSVRIPAQSTVHVTESETAGEWSHETHKRSPQLKMLEKTSIPDTGEKSSHLILVVDDNEMNCEVVRDILTLEGYEVVLAFGGQDALLKLREHHPDLVLLDLMMPEVSGEDVLQAMRADPELDNIPVILLTARATEEDRIHGLEIGADDYLAKPLIARELIVRVHNLLLRIESTRLLEGVEHREKMALMGELLSDLSHELKNIHHADAYGSKSLLEHVEPILGLFPELPHGSVTATILLAEGLDIAASQVREEKLLRTLTGKPDRYDRRLALYVSSLSISEEASVIVWTWARQLPETRRRAWESLLAMIQHMNTLGQSSERTQELITAVLDYGRYHKAQSTVDVSRVITSSLIFLQARFRRAGIRVENQVGCLEAQASSSDVQQITLNILNNAYDAIKDLGEDQERLVIISAEEDAPHQAIRLRFVNKGPAIPPDVLPRIFERRFTTKGDKGSGLGLYVSRRLAVKNHGDLQAESRDGETAFELTLRKAG